LTNISVVNGSDTVRQSTPCGQVFNVSFQLYFTVAPTVVKLSLPSHVCVRSTQDVSVFCFLFVNVEFGYFKFGSY